MYDQLGIRRLFSNPFQSWGKTKVEKVQNFLKRTLTKFLENNDLKWDVIAVTHFQAAMAEHFHSSLCLDEINQKDAYLILPIVVGFMESMKRK